MKVFPSKQEKLITVAITAFVIGIILGLLSKVSADKYLPNLVTLVAAFVGAYSAFALQSKKQDKVLVASRVEAGNKAIFELIRTYNQFLGLRNQFIQEYREDPLKHVLIMPVAGGLHITKFNFDEISFLFDSEEPNLLGQLAMFQQEVASTIDVIAQRSKLHVEEIQPTVEKLEQQHGEKITLEQIETALGRRTTKTLKILTEYMIDGVDRIISDADKHIDKMNKILKKKYPEHKIIGMLKPNKSIQPTPKSGAADAAR